MESSPHGLSPISLTLSARYRVAVPGVENGAVVGWNTCAESGPLQQGGFSARAGAYELPASRSGPWL